MSISFAGRIEAALLTSEVGFRKLEGDEIVCYVASGEALDKSAAYAIHSIVKPEIPSNISPGE